MHGSESALPSLIAICTHVRRTSLLEHIPPLITLHIIISPLTIGATLLRQVIEAFANVWISLQEHPLMVFSDSDSGSDTDDDHDKPRDESPLDYFSLL